MATSTTAMSITGDVSISGTRLTKAGHEIFTLEKKAELSRFKTLLGDEDVTVFAVKPPRNAVFNRNHLCPKSAKWIITWLMPGHQLEVAIFDSRQQPQAGDGKGSCGDFFYTRDIHTDGP